MYQSNDGISLCIEGRFDVDAIVSSNTITEAYQGGLHLKHLKTGRQCFINTDRPPRPGRRLYATSPLDDVVESGLVRNLRAGGRAMNTARAMAERFLLRKLPGKMAILNSTAKTRELDRECRRLAIEHHSLGRQPTPTNVVVPMGNDRVIVHQRVKPCLSSLVGPQVDQVDEIVRNVDAVVCTAGNDASLAIASDTFCNGAVRYHRPTSLLPTELTFNLAAQAHEVVTSFEELKRLTPWLRTSPIDIDKDDREAFNVTIRLLLELKRRHWAGSRAICCTLGRQGSVAMNWERRVGHTIRVRMIDASGANPNRWGAGDRFLGEWVVLRQTWSNQGHLRYPILATAVRSTHYVADWIGLKRTSYTVETNTFSL